MNDNKIPFLDLVAPHLELEEEIVGVMREALRNGQFTGGPLVEAFEKDFADFCKAGRCVAVSSGTDALRFALMAAGLRPGETVLTVPNTFIATAEAITQAGALVDFVDVDGKTCNMCPDKLREYMERKCRGYGKGRHISRKTGSAVSAVIPVHLYGQMADMDCINAVAADYKLKVVEDACQAHGARFFSKKDNCWRTAGSMGVAAAFSFYPGKNLGACGEGGAVTTNDEEAATRVKMLRDHGQVKKYYHDIEGYNGRLDAIQAGILGLKLKRLDEWNSLRRVKAYYYNELLSDIKGVRTPYEPLWSRAVYHIYAIRVRDRENMQSHLSKAHIGTGLHYPLPLHLQKAYSRLGYGKGSFPAAEASAESILSLPMYPGLTDAQQRRVADAISDFASGCASVHKAQKELRGAN
ncbi:MAG: DegT/DnrJ/EryC1/StrS family aminotransferase [Deltaproteobacteria bacterium]|nr:DegT/DnrJ/EryC1/StrS family aminotransferase [Deltaproteobacteria bacterium]